LGILPFNCVSHLNPLFSMFVVFKENSHPVFCTVAFRLAFTELNPVVPGRGVPTNWFDERLRYHDTEGAILPLKNSSSNAASIFLLVSQLKSGLYSLKGSNPTNPSYF